MKQAPQTIRSLFLACAAALGGILLPARAGAAPPVFTDRRPVLSGPYNNAASRLGFSDWGAPVPPVRVFLRPGVERHRLTIALPPSTPQPGAVQWLGALSDSMGWQDPSLVVNPQPDALYLRADFAAGSSGRRLGRLRSRVGLDLELLRARLAELTQAPILLAVRTTGGDLARVSPEPDVRGRSGMSEYLFYRLPGASGGLPTGKLVLEFGLSDRWLAAAVVTVLLWLVCPFVALRTVRDHLLKSRTGDSRQKLQAYRRWQRGVLFGTILGSQASLFLLGFSRLLFLLANGGILLLMLTLFLPMAGIPLAARLIGLPLEREAWPHRRSLPWYRAAAGELFLTVMMLGIPLFAAGPMLLSRSPSSGGPFTGALPYLLLFPIALVSLVILVVGIRTALRWRQRRRGAKGAEPPASEELSAAVRDLTTRLDCPVGRVLLLKVGSAPAALAARDGVAVVSRELAEALAPDQLAGLVAAAALAQPRTRVEKSWAALQWGLALLPLAFFGLVLYSAGSGGLRGGGPMPFVVLFPLLMLVPGMLLGRREQGRQEARDFRVAEAMSEPRRFLDALRRLEEFQLSALAGDPAALQRSNVFTQRRLRLERRLGLE